MRENPSHAVQTPEDVVLPSIYLRNDVFHLYFASLRLNEVLWQI